MFLTEAGHWVGTVGEIFNYQGYFFLIPTVDKWLEAKPTYVSMMENLWLEHNTKYLWVMYRGGLSITSNQRVVKLPDDIKGLKIRSPMAAGRTSIDTAGGTGVSLAVAEVYDALDKGTLDGALTGAESIWTRGFWEVSPYNSGSFNIELWPVIMNLDVWKGLSEADKQLISKTAQEIEAWSIGAYKEADQTAIDNIIKNGAEFYTLTAGDQAKWVEVMKPAHEKYVTDSTNEGHGDEVRAFMKALKIPGY